MKLLYITNGINGAGGLERVLSIKASYLAEHYHYDVTILSLNDNHLDPFYTFSDKIIMLSIPVKGNAYQYIKQYCKGLKSVVDTVQPDVISVCDDGLKAFFTPVILGKKVPVIYERHVSKEIEMKAEFSFLKKTLVRLKWRLMESLASRFSKFIVLTNGNIKEWQGLKHIQVISNPLSFYPEASSTLDSKKVICVGKISYQKGQDLLVKAWSQVFEKHPDWGLELYGYANTTFLDTSLLKSINVSYYPPEKHIKDKYLDSSIYVMSSRFEGFGMVLTEAMACGVPCVSFNCNYGPSDIIKDGVDGFLVEKQDVKELADTICTLIDNDALRSEMGQLAKKNVKRYLPETIVKQWDELFKSLDIENTIPK
ncbi:glycosyltransferase family 4 protein [Bizionia sp. KMM 8389]